MLQAAVYSETQRFPYRWLIAVAYSLAFAAIAYFVAMPRWLAITVLIAGVLTAAQLYMMLALRIRVTTYTLEFGYWTSRPKIPLSDIEEIEIVTIPSVSGLGARDYEGSWVYNSQFGRGVKIRTVDHQYIIGSRTPEQFKSVLLGMIPRKPLS